MKQWKFKIPLVAAIVALGIATLGLVACGGSGASSSSSSAAATMQVEVTIDATKADDKAFDTIVKTVDLDEGASAFNALGATGIEIVDSDGYVTTINSLAAGDCGAESGWTYSVNGESATVGAGDYELSSGDKVTWTYITSFDDM